MKRWFIFLLLSVIAIPAFAARNIIYIFDASGSMWGQMEGRTKIEIARDVLSDQIPSFADKDINAGLIVYGHRRRGDCEDIEQVVKLKPLDERDLIAKIESIQPKGKTPIAASIRFATNQLKVFEEEATIVLVSDGKETCNADPCQAVAQLKNVGVDFVLHVVGFDVNPEEKRQLQCIARAGGGKYIGATNATELTLALQQVAPAEPVTIAQENIELIVDGSNAMGEAFDNSTRLEAVIASVNDVLNLQALDRDKLALRKYGGSCVGEKTSLLVPFARNNVGEIRKNLSAITPNGKSILPAAVIAAADDFDNLRQFPEAVSRRVVIIAGKDYEACMERPLDKIYRKLKAKNIKPEFYFIGMDLPDARLRGLKKVAGAAGGRFSHVTTRNDLTRVLKRIIELDPVIGSIKRLTAILNQVTKNVNRMFNDVRRKEYTAAENALSNASQEMETSKLPFTDLSKRQNRQDFSTLYQIAKANRDLQHRMLVLAGNIVDRAKADDIEALNSSVKEINSVTSHYNENIKKINQIIKSF